MTKARVTTLVEGHNLHSLKHVGSVLRMRNTLCIPVELANQPWGKGTGKLDGKGKGSLSSRSTISCRYTRAMKLSPSTSMSSPSISHCSMVKFWTPREIRCTGQPICTVPYTPLHSLDPSAKQLNGLQSFYDEVCESWPWDHRYFRYKLDMVLRVIPYGRIISLACDCAGNQMSARLLRKCVMAFFLFASDDCSGIARNRTFYEELNRETMFSFR